MSFCGDDEECLAWSHVGHPCLLNTNGIGIFNFLKKMESLVIQMGFMTPFFILVNDCSNAIIPFGWFHPMLNAGLVHLREHILLF